MLIFHFIYFNKDILLNLENLGFKIKYEIITAENPITLPIKTSTKKC